MKLAAYSLMGLGLGLAAFAANQGCSSDDPGAASNASTLGKPPALPASAKDTTSTDEHNFAMYSLLLGDADRKGVASQTAWKKYGYNIDGKVTTASSKDVCTPAAGASKTVQVDGDTGIDNSFGENILPIVLTTAGSDATTKINDSIQSGGFTIMFDTKGLTADPAQTASKLSGQLFAGGKFDPNGAKPTWTTADKWPVRPELLQDGKTAAGGSTIQFNSAFVVNGTFVNGSPAEVTIALGIQGVSLNIKIHQAIITFDHRGATADNGTIAGVIDTEELINGLKVVAGRISTSLCSGSAFDSIAQQIRQASDILIDGTNKAGVPCSGISIGLGFIAKEIAPPSTVADLGTPSADPCAPATDAGTD